MMGIIVDFRGWLILNHPPICFHAQLKSLGHMGNLNIDNSSCKNLLHLKLGLSQFRNLTSF